MIKARLIGLSAVNSVPFLAKFRRSSLMAAASLLDRLALHHTSCPLPLQAACSRERSPQLLGSGWFGASVKHNYSSFSREQRSREVPVKRLTTFAQEVPLTAPPAADSSNSNGSATVGLTTPSRPSLPEITFESLDTPTMEFKGDLLLLGIFEDSLDPENKFSFLDSFLTEVDASLSGILSEVASEGEFKGKSGQTVNVRLQGLGVKRLGLVGLGKKDNASTAGTWKSLGGSLAIIAKQVKAVTAGVAIIDTKGLGTAALTAAAGSISTGTLLGAFEDSRFKAEVKPPTLQSVTLFGLPTGEEVEEVFGMAARLAAGIILTKQLVNAPANVLTPCALAEVAEAIAFAHSDVMTATILDEKECEALGMGAYLGVAAASTNPPRFIHLKYTPEGPITTKLAIVGKGLTFDSGGYNIKAGAGSMIELMKFDMGGAGATLGAAKAIGAIQPPGVEVHFIVAACENMISGGGMRPGDILTASNGRTIEVGNTDAEGRLTLADALIYTCKLGPNKIVDLATLTGACIIALGNDIAGMFTPQDSMAEELQEASKGVGEKLWRMPMEESYAEMLKSNIADTSNVGGRAAGSITAALFLKEFVDKDIPWAHLDIAGPVWSEKKGGGTGFGVATLVQWVTQHAKVTA